MTFRIAVCGVSAGFGLFSVAWRTLCFPAPRPACTTQGVTGLCFQPSNISLLFILASPQCALPCIRCRSLCSSRWHDITTHKHRPFASPHYFFFGGAKPNCDRSMPFISFIIVIRLSAPPSCCIILGSMQDCSCCIIIFGFRFIMSCSQLAPCDTMTRMRQVACELWTTSTQ